MQIGVLYICTGKYNIFWKSFYESSQKYFLPDHEKTYFVFTDATNLDYQSEKNVIIIFREKVPWPYSTMSRFKYFVENKDLLKNTDYLFFCNANLLFVDTVNDEILPVEEGFAALLQPGYWDKPRDKFPYETNPGSLAYIPSDKGKYYFMGSLNGGKTNAFLKMCEVLNNNINEDLKKNIIAIWHDESHLNCYLSDKNVRLLDPSFGYPEDWNLPFKPKIIIRDKTKYGGLGFLRSGKKNIFAKFVSKLKNHKI